MAPFLPGYTTLNSFLDLYLTTWRDICLSGELDNWGQETLTDHLG